MTSGIFSFFKGGVRDAEDGDKEQQGQRHLRESED